MDIPLHVLRYFCVLADELHFGKAAAALNISAPSLSQQISRLEKTIGTPLFERTPRQVLLTAAGAELLPLARRVRDDHDDLLRWASQRQGHGDLLRIGIVAAGAGSLTTAILTSAVQRMPTVRVEMRRLGFFDTPGELLGGRVDVAFCPAPMGDLDDRISAHPLWSEPRVLVVPSTHALAERDSVSVDEIRDEVFVSAGGGDPEILNWWIVDPRPDGSHPRRGPVADDFEGLLELVAAGAGVNIASASAGMHYRRDGVAFVRIVDIEPTTILLCSLKRPSNPAVAAFVEIAKNLTVPLADATQRAVR